MVVSRQVTVIKCKFFKPILSDSYLKQPASDNALYTAVSTIAAHFLWSTQFLAIENILLKITEISAGIYRFCEKSPKFHV